MSISAAKWSIQGRDRFPRLLFSRTTDWRAKLWRRLTGRVLTGRLTAGDKRRHSMATACTFTAHAPPRAWHIVRLCMSVPARLDRLHGQLAYATAMRATRVVWNGPFRGPRPYRFRVGPKNETERPKRCSVENGCTAVLLRVRVRESVPA